MDQRLRRSVVYLWMLIALLLQLWPCQGVKAQEKGLADSTQRLVVSGEGYFPVAQRLKDGRIAVVLRGGAKHVGITGRLDMVFSEDDGRTWGKPVVVNDSPLDDRNPAFGQAANGDLVVAFWRTAKNSFKDYTANLPDQPDSTWVTRSADGGRTWSGAVEIDVHDIGFGSPYGKMLTLADGTMRMNVYGHAIRGAGEHPQPELDHSYLYRSIDGGHVWKRHGTMGKGFNETAMLDLAEGKILAAMRLAGDKANVWMTRSVDGGQTWAKPQELSTPAAHPADLTRLPDGRLLMVTGFRAGPFGLRGIIGDAEGHFLWKDRFALIDDSTSADTGYPSSVVMKDGRVLTFYYAVGSKTHPEWGIHCGVVDYRPAAETAK
jgi:hypothetical protein